jgi:acetyl esterase/lipase
MKKILIALLVVCSITVRAQQTIDLYPIQAPNSKSTNDIEAVSYFRAGADSVRFITKVIKPELTIYLPAKEKNTGMAVIICPGGGYSGVAIDHEGHAIAKRLQANGIAGFVLKYRMPNSDLVLNKEFVPLMDAQRAIQIVRENAKKYGVNPKKIGIMGSSAGGHLASTAGTHYNKEQVNNPLKTSLRPDFMILNYPVISFADSLTHGGSRSNLLPAITPEKIREYSNELQVDSKTPPAFVTHAVDDNVVKVQNSILFIAALQKNKVPVESFFYANGGHGYGIVNPTSNVQWIDACLKWMKRSL